VTGVAAESLPGCGQRPCRAEGVPGRFSGADFNLKLRQACGKISLSKAK